MSTFLNRGRLSDPQATAVIPTDDLAYVVTRTQLDAFNTVHRELARTGMQRNELARRLKMNEGQLSRLLAAPGNWGLATAAKLLWAISGARLQFTVDYPLVNARRNDSENWLEAVPSEPPAE